MQNEKLRINQLTKKSTLSSDKVAEASKTSYTISEFVSTMLSLTHRDLQLSIKGVLRSRSMLIDFSTLGTSVT